jgi:hypothetical protein
MVIGLMALSFALVPFNTVHAHFAGDHDHSVLHGGHIHDFEHRETAPGQPSADHVVAVKMTAADHGSFSLSASWMPVLWLLVAMTLGVAAMREVFRPPGADPGPPKRRSWRLPPLRGPPLLSI